MSKKEKNLEPTELIVPNTELDKIYRSGRVSSGARRIFKASLDKDLYSTQGMNLERFIDNNRKIKIEMKEYLDNYKVQRSLMESVIYYLKHPNLAPVRFADKVGNLFGRNLQLEAKKIANDPQAIVQLFEDIAYSIGQSRVKTQELEKQAMALYDSTLTQRENIEKDIATLLQNIASNNDMTVKLEDDHNKINENMDKLLEYMQNKLGVQFKGAIPLLEGVEVGKEDASKNIEAIGSESLESPVSESSASPESYETRISQLVNDDAKKRKEQVRETNDDAKEEKKDDPRVLYKKKIESIIIYHSINNELVKADNLLRDTKNEKLVLHQDYEKAKENLTLYEKVLLYQMNEARNYFSLLFAIYDAEIKYTIPTARLVAYLASLQEVAAQLTQRILETRNIFNNLLDNVTEGALEIQENIISIAINPSWDPKIIEQAETRSIELTRRTKEFINEMDKRLIEIEAFYKDPATQLKFRENTALDSGIKDDFIQKLLSDRKEKDAI